MEQQPTVALTPAAKVPLYTRIGFALLVVFGMIGNCMGRTDQALMIIVVTIVVWTSTRMIQEGLEAYRILALARQLNAATKKPADPAE
jgi:hypothetical protein